jgi:hypothetical protein
VSAFTPFVLLAVLCLTDAAFAGYRDAAGRDARIFKAELYRRAIRRGMYFGLGVAGVTVALAAAVLAAAPSPGVRFGELTTTAWWMLPILAVYATVVLAAMGLWVVAEADVRTLASVTVLGPFTLIRPLVIAAAGALGAWRAPSFPAALVALGSAALQMGLEPCLGRAWRNGGRPLG